MWPAIHDRHADSPVTPVGISRGELLPPGDAVVLRMIKGARRTTGGVIRDGVRRLKKVAVSKSGGDACLDGLALAR
ncbi:MAG: hypothetical protein U1F83_06555 [Verrucomicrobiota bacterium]